MLNQLTALIQIFTESLPISSSGHVQLIQEFLHIPPDATTVTTLFDYALHLPTACIIALFFHSDYIPTIIGIRKTWPFVLRIFCYGFVAELMTVFWYAAIVYMQLRIPLWVGFAMTTMSLLSLYFCTPHNYSSMNMRKALLLGCMQGIALFGGISRFACTYTVCCWMGLRPMRALQWSMMVQWPLIFVAALYGTYALYAARILQLLHASYWLSMLGATVIAYGLLWGMYYMVRYNIMWIWGIYMLIPTVIAWYTNV
jgi:undecaprenyl-diphosphatase